MKPNDIISYSLNVSLVNASISFLLVLLALPTFKIFKNYFKSTNWLLIAVHFLLTSVILLFFIAHYAALIEYLLYHLSYTFQSTMNAITFLKQQPLALSICTIASVIGLKLTGLYGVEKLTFNKRLLVTLFFLIFWISFTLLLNTCDNFSDQIDCLLKKGISIALVMILIKRPSRVSS